MNRSLPMHGERSQNACVVPDLFLWSLLFVVVFVFVVCCFRHYVVGCLCYLCCLLFLLFVVFVIMLLVVYVIYVVCCFCCLCCL